MGSRGTNHKPCDGITSPLDSILKSKRHHFANKGPYSQSKDFSSSHVWKFESCTIKKAERRRIDALQLWCWRRLLRVPWTARRSNQSILKEISPEYSLEGLMLKLKLQYFGHLMRKTDALEKTLTLGKIKGRRRRGRQKEMYNKVHYAWSSGKCIILKIYTPQKSSFFPSIWVVPKEKVKS